MNHPGIQSANVRVDIIYYSRNLSSHIVQRLILAVSSTGRCNAILNQGRRCYETKNAHLLHARTESDYLGQIKARGFPA